MAPKGGSKRLAPNAPDAAQTSDPTSTGRGGKRGRGSQKQPKEEDGSKKLRGSAPAHALSSQVQRCEESSQGASALMSEHAEHESLAGQAECHGSDPATSSGPKQSSLHAAFQASHKAVTKERIDRVADNVIARVEKWRACRLADLAKPEDSQVAMAIAEGEQLAEDGQFPPTFEELNQTLLSPAISVSARLPQVGLAPPQKVQPAAAKGAAVGTIVFVDEEEVAYSASPDASGPLEHAEMATLGAGSGVAGQPVHGVDATVQSLHAVDPSTLGHPPVDLSWKAWNARHGSIFDEPCCIRDGQPGTPKSEFIPSLALELPAELATSPSGIDQVCLASLGTGIVGSLPSLGDSLAASLGLDFAEGAEAICSFDGLFSADYIFS